MLENEKIERPRWWTAQRSYYYESHDADGNFNGLTAEEWKNRIIEEWEARRLKAYHSTIIFHDKDTEKDENGNITNRDLHAHLCVWFIDGHTQTSAMKATGASRIENVKAIKKTKKASAYRYLLHITEKALKDAKYIYGEDELIISKSTSDIKYDFHKLIKQSEKEEEKEEEKDLLNKTIKDIMNGDYDTKTILLPTVTTYKVYALKEATYYFTPDPQGDFNENYKMVRVGNSLEAVSPIGKDEILQTEDSTPSKTLDIMTQLLKISQIANLIGSSSKCRREIKNAVDTREEVIKANT